MLDEEQFSDESLTVTDDGWTISFARRADLKHRSHPKCMCSPTQFSAEVPRHWVQPVLQTFGKRRQKQS